MTDKQQPPNEPGRAAARISDADAAAAYAESVAADLLDGHDGQVHVALEERGATVSDEYIDTLFRWLMQSAMAAGGRKLATEWIDRLNVLGKGRERACRAMAETVNLKLSFGALAPPLAVQAGCHADVLQHEQQDADAIARLAVRGIATESEVHKMRQRLVKRIVNAVMSDTRPQTAERNQPHESTRDQGTPPDVGEHAGHG
jgi:hypothetical protein